MAITPDRGRASPPARRTGCGASRRISRSGCSRKCSSLWSDRSLAMKGRNAGCAGDWRSAVRGVRAYDPYNPQRLPNRNDRQARPQSLAELPGMRFCDVMLAVLTADGATGGPSILSRFVADLTQSDFWRQNAKCFCDGCLSAEIGATKCFCRDRNRSPGRGESAGLAVEIASRPIRPCGPCRPNRLGPHGRGVRVKTPISVTRRRDVVEAIG